MLDALAKQPPRTIFRAYDIRGIVGDTLTDETVFLTGQALGSLVRECGEKEVCIARDGRLSSPALSKQLAAGLMQVGCDVIDLGMTPTPVLYFATHVLNARSGMMVTGSHNSSEYNGLKMVLLGQTLTEEEINNLYQRILDRRFYRDNQGHYHSLDLTTHYIEAITSDIHLIRPLKIVVDAGHGVAGLIAPMLYRALGCTVYPLYCDVDGHFPHHHADPSQKENLQDLIKAIAYHQADLGLAFDGDGDRLGVTTNAGDIIWPDRVLMLYARDVLQQHPNATILYDVKCTSHLDPFIRKQNGSPLMWKTGHSLLKTKMKEVHALLAGEMSGHFFFKDRWHGGDDALYAGARLLSILSHQNHSAHDVFQSLPNSVNTPEIKVSIEEDEKFSFMKALVQYVTSEFRYPFSTLDGLRVHFDRGWGLIRASNTSPYLVLRFEAGDEETLYAIQAQFKTWMLVVKPDLKLAF